MNKPLALLVAACALLAAPIEASPEAAGTALGTGDPTAATACTGLPGSFWAPLPADSLASGRDWILRTSDNVCGLRDPNQLTYPAKIDFGACLDATPEMTRLRNRGIDPKSAEGIQLRSAAVTRLTDACEAVRTASGHCSVWKAIRHKDGRTIPDISTQVIAQY